MSSVTPGIDDQTQRIRKLTARWRTVFWSIFGLMALVVILYLVPVSGPLAYLSFFSFFICSLVAGLLTLTAANSGVAYRSSVQVRWAQRERIGWTLVSIGLFFWSFAELIWRYQRLVGHSTFPSVADIGYSLMPVLAFAGLLFQPTVFRSRKESLLSGLDCLIATGSIVAIAWYFFFGRRMFTTHWEGFGPFLSIYYPATDTVLLCCVVASLLHCKSYILQTRTFMWSWILMGGGFASFLVSDVMVNIQQGYHDFLGRSPFALGWGIGLLMFALVAPVRYLSSLRDKPVDQQVSAWKKLPDFTLISILPYFLVGLLFMVVVASTFLDDDRLTISVLVIIAASVFCTLIIRQILMMHDNARLARSQARALLQLEEVSKQLEVQAGLVAKRNEELEQGIQHLKYVQASLANGNLRARAHLASGELLPLAGSLNLLADRLMRLELADVYCENLTAALIEICNVTERWRMGKPFVLYPLYKQFAITKRLVNAIGLPGPSSSGRYPLFSNSGGTQTIQKPQMADEQPEKENPYPPFKIDRKLPD